MSRSKRLRNKRRYTGQFNCPCGHNWTSYDLKMQECQDCTLCGKTDVFPTLASLTTEVDTCDFVAIDHKKYFGQYQCFKCLRTWVSAHSWLDYSQMCRNCSTWTEAHRMRQLNKPKGMNNRSDPKKAHQTDMCAKCRQLGHNCKNVQQLKKLFQKLSI